MCRLNMTRSLLANGHVLEDFLAREHVYRTLADFSKELSNTAIEQELSICRPSVEFEQMWIIELSCKRNFLVASYTL
jgi:hypothetical protein